MESLSKLLGGNSPTDLIDMYNMVMSSPDIQNEVANMIRSFAIPSSSTSDVETPTAECRTSSPEPEVRSPSNASPKVAEYSATFSQILEYIKTLESKEASWKGVVKQIQLENTDLRKRIADLESNSTDLNEQEKRLKASEQENEKLRNALEILMTRL